MGQRRHPVEDQGTRQRPQRVQALAGQGHSRMNHSSALPPTHPDRGPDGHLQRELAHDCDKAPPLRPPAASRLAISAMPTGSFAPDSPSRMVPLRPAISRWPSTENTTAGSVGATAVATSSAAYQSRPNT